MQHSRRRSISVILAVCLVLLACAPAMASPITIDKVHKVISLEDLGFTVEAPDNIYDGICKLEALPLDSAKLPAIDQYYLTRTVELKMTTASQTLYYLIKPLRLTFAFDQIDFKRAANMDVSQPLGRFRVGRWDDSTQSWKELPSTIYWDGSQGKIEAQSVLGAGKYALLWNYADSAQLSPFSDGSIRLMVNYDVVELPAAPYVANGRTMVPLRFAQNLGYTIKWDPLEKCVTLNKNGKTLNLWVGKYQVEVDGVASTIDATPEIVGNYTYVPMSFIAQSMDAQINWDPLEKTARILWQ